MRTRRAAVALLATGVAAVAVVPAANSGAATTPPRKTIKVGDDYFSPAKLTVKKNTTVVFKWLAVNGDTHDVKLSKGPKGVKHFHSDAAATDFSYKRKLTVKGKYHVICTFHQDMVTNITVK
jgi:plastocyanin